MARRKKLYMEERLGYLKRALNEKSMDFQDAMPTKELKEKFHVYIMACIELVYGDEDGSAREVLDLKD